MNHAASIRSFFLGQGLDHRLQGVLLHRTQHLDQLLLLLLSLANRLDEWMLQQLLCALTLAWSLPQAAVHEVYEIVAALRQFWRVAVDDTLHGQVMLHPQKWWFALNELNCHHSQRPNVYLLIVRFLLYQLRSHPSRRPNQRLPAQYLLSELYGKPKIRNLDLSLQAHKHIIALQIPMQLPPAMQALQSLQHILQNIGNDILRYLFEIKVNEIHHRSAVHKLNKHEQRFLIVVGEVMSGEVGGVTEIHDCNFRADFVEGAIVFELNDTAGVVFSVLLGAVVGEEDLAHCTLAQLLLENELTRWVLFDEVHVLYHCLKLACRQQLRLNVTLNQRRVVLFLQLLRPVLLILRIFRDREVDLIRPLLGQIFEPAILVPLDMEAMFDVLRSALGNNYSEKLKGMVLISESMDSGSSSSALTVSGISLVDPNFLQSILKGSSQLLAHSAGTPSNRPVSLFLRILMPPGSRMGFPESNFFCCSSVNFG